MTPRERHENNLAKAASRIKRSNGVAPKRLAYYLCVSERTARKYFAELKRRDGRFICDLKRGYMHTRNLKAINAYQERLSKHAKSELGNTTAHRQAKRRGYNRRLGL